MRVVWLAGPADELRASEHAAPVKKGGTIELSEEQLESLVRLGYRFEEVEAFEANQRSELSEHYGADVADKLAAAGYTTVAAVQAASDDELDAVEGVGPATVQRIRETDAADDQPATEPGFFDEAEEPPADGDEFLA